MIEGVNKRAESHDMQKVTPLDGRYLYFKSGDPDPKLGVSKILSRRSGIEGKKIF